MSISAIEQIIFVYNADAGFFSTLSDFTHKIFSPETYQCNLCKITYGNFAMKSEWKEFLASLPQQKVFLHKNEFLEKYPQFKNIHLPAVFAHSKEGLRQIVTAYEINQQKEINDFKNLLIQKLT